MQDIHSGGLKQISAWEDKCKKNNRLLDRSSDVFPLDVSGLIYTPKRQCVSETPHIAMAPLPYNSVEMVYHKAGKSTFFGIYMKQLCVMMIRQG